VSVWALFAPGPSASAELAESVRHIPTGAVSNAYQLAPWAQFVAASDAAWWRKYPEAMKFPERYAMAPVGGVERVWSKFGAPCNSGVLALEVVKMKGAKRVILLGFDMRGDHFFGRYTNGLTNTSPDRRRAHLRQYEAWAKANRDIEVLNATTGSALTCFPMARIDDVADLQRTAA
jgi:hypothetical protein